MGFLRIYLALCVVQAHAGLFIPVNAPTGRHAVALFFIISGFYMEMVLSDRYKTIRDFYASRWLRISVPYYFHLAAIVLLSVASGLIFSQWLSLSGFASDPFSHNGPAGIFLASLTNLTVFGQDIVLFLRDNAGGDLRFTGDFSRHPAPLYNYLVIPQCWSISIELTFYLLAPFLHRLKTLPLALLLAGSLSARLVAYNFMGLDHDPWLYRFMPFELALFVAGMLGWRFACCVESGIGKASPPGRFGYLGICLLVLSAGHFFTGFSWAIGSRIGQANAEIVLILLSMPLIVLAFHFTRSHFLDRVVGELSYPIYLNHLFIVVALRAFPAFSGARAHIGLWTACLSCISAWAFWRYFLRRFEDSRHKRFGLNQISA